MLKIVCVYTVYRCVFPIVLPRIKELYLLIHNHLLIVSKFVLCIKLSLFPFFSQYFCHVPPRPAFETPIQKAESQGLE